MIKTKKKIFSSKCEWKSIFYFWQVISEVNNGENINGRIIENGSYRCI